VSGGMTHLMEGRLGILTTVFEAGSAMT